MKPLQQPYSLFMKSPVPFASPFLSNTVRVLPSNSHTQFQRRILVICNQRISLCWKSHQKTPRWLPRQEGNSPKLHQKKLFATRSCKRRGHTAITKAMTRAKSGVSLVLPNRTQRTDRHVELFITESISGTTCCSVRFLARLLDDIQMLSALELKMLHLKTRTASPIPADNHVYQTIEAEVARLAAYPCLFPNDGFRRFFMRRAHDLSKAGKGLAMGWDRSRSLMAEASNKIHESQGNWLHKCRDPKRTSWQQFLHSSGPGSGLSLSTFPTDGCTRVFPHAGMELLRSWFEKNEDVEHQINQVRSNRLLRLSCLAFY